MTFSVDPMDVLLPILRTDLPGVHVFSRVPDPVPGDLGRLDPPGPRVVGAGRDQRSGRAAVRALPGHLRALDPQGHQRLIHDPWNRGKIETKMPPQCCNTRGPADPTGTDRRDRAYLPCLRSPNRSFSSCGRQGLLHVVVSGVGASPPGREEADRDDLVRLPVQVLRQDVHPREALRQAASFLWGSLLGVIPAL
jgi:hypothetical protein